VALASWLVRQNSPEAHTALGAADFWWGSAQRLRALEVLAVVLAPTALAITAQFLPGLVVPAALVGFALTFIDTVAIYPALAALRYHGAQAQDIFDSLALGIPRSSFRRQGDPDPTDLQVAFARQDRTRALRNVDWYTPLLGELPQHLGRVACLLESAAWDGGLRNRYCNAIFGCVVALVLLIVTYALYGPHREEIVVRILFPLMPVIVWAGREWWDQRNASSAVLRLREALQRLWDDAIRQRVTEGALDAAAIDFASAFFAFRSKTPPTPHGLYRLLRPQQTTSLQGVAELRLQEYRASLGAPL
jgi:hypothetical protein